MRRKGVQSLEILGGGRAGRGPQHAGHVERPEEPVLFHPQHAERRERERVHRTGPVTGLVWLWILALELDTASAVPHTNMCSEQLNPYCCGWNQTGSV